MTITTGHLCSGYDGLGFALAEAEPHRALWHSEIDPAMSRVLAREQPEVPNAGNLVELLRDDLWRLAPQPDLLSAGFPCQPISVAGRGLADLDPRWLWPFIREVYRQTSPFRIFLENVQNLVSIQSGAILRGILADLREDGYAARWVVLGACAVGAPHHRHRWFLVADSVAGPAPDAVRIEPRAICGAPRVGGRLLLPTPTRSDAKGPGISRMERGEAPWADLASAVALLPTPNARDGGARGTPSREHAERRAADPMRSVNLEDAVALLPTPRATDVGTPGRRSSEGWRPQLGQAALLLPTPRASDGERGRGNCGQGFSGGGETLGAASHPDRWGKYALAVALWEQITGIPAPEPTEPGRNGGPRLSAALPEWMMGLSPGYLTKDLTRAEALRGAGNGVVPRQAAAAYRLLTS